jgi:hypothetical protein
MTMKEEKKMQTLDLPFLPIEMKKEKKYEDFIRYW